MRRAVADLTTSAPIFVAGALFVAAAIIVRRSPSVQLGDLAEQTQTLVIPLESRGRAAL